MDDLIRKSDALETYADLYDIFDDNKAIQEELHKVFDKINNIPAVEPKQGEWISCEERLPEEIGRYLCTVGAEYRTSREMYYAPQAWAGRSDHATWRSIDGSYVFDWFVEAWMPLPTPYMKGSDDEML